ncbi:hypothetical protein ABT247_17015 [Kitasatospora sp. NPDC001539]|uniref:hypothetical protein n=1 Tax=Kitasatospora sp. NPDC001539 TaxID=3154384 RepID=UPI00332C0B2F
MNRHRPRTTTPAVTLAVTLAGSLALPYIALKSYWAAGGRAGLGAGFDMGDEFRRNGAPAALVWLERHGVDFTAVLALTGLALAVVLARRPPRRRPLRLLLLTAARAGTLLVPYGLLTALLGALGHGDGPGHDPLTGWVVPAGAAAFTGIGTALAVASWPYRSSGDCPVRPTRPASPTRPSEPEPKPAPAPAAQQSTTPN